MQSYPGQSPVSGSPAPQPYYAPYAPNAPYGPNLPPKKNQTALNIVRIGGVVGLIIIFSSLIYVLTIGFDTNTHHPRTIVLFSGLTKTTPTTWTFRPEPDRSYQISSYQIAVRNGSVVAISETTLSNCVSSPCSGDGGLSIQLSDVASVNQLTNVDLFTLRFLDPNTLNDTYTVEVLYGGSMAGNIKIP